jgi:hypothetical protein
VALEAQDRLVAESLFSLLDTFLALLLEALDI